MAPRRSTFEQLLSGLGRALEEADLRGRGKGGAGEPAFEAQRVAAAWLVGRTLRPRHINWPRLLAATAAGVVLGEVLTGLGPYRNGRKLPPGRSRVVSDPEAPEAPDTAEPSEYAPDEATAHAGDAARDSGPHAARHAGPDGAGAVADEDPGDYDAEPLPGPRSARRARAYERAVEASDATGHVRTLLERIGGDLAVAAAYASVAYPRLPGPPFARAVMFGAADAAVAATGGIAATLAGFSPRLKLPLKQLLLDEERAIERSLALALALAVIYRDPRYDD